MGRFSEGEMRDLAFAMVAADLGYTDVRGAVAALYETLDASTDGGRSIRAAMIARLGLQPEQVAVTDAALKGCLASVAGEVGSEGETTPGPAVTHPDLAATLKEEAGGGDGPPGVSLRPTPPGRYSGFQKVGAGGMGIVYLALDRDLSREVAFKIVNPSAFAEDGRAGQGEEPTEQVAPAADTPASRAFATLKARFLQEALITAHLPHPSIVPVYEVGQTAGGVPYYTMKFVRGERTFADEIKGAETLEDRLGLLEPFLDLCNAVAYAHRQGVVHRDLKPQNVQRGSFGETVLLDWGLARTVGTEDPAEDARWQEHIAQLRGETGLRTMGVLGTPGYMAPEVFGGEPSRIDERSDQYSLGATLYEILTGMLPHELDRSEGFTEGFTAYARTVRSEDAVPATNLNSRIPRELSDVCARALAREPGARFASVEEMADAVRAWQRASARRQQRAERRALASRVGMAAALVLLAAVAGFLWRTDALRRDAEIQRREAEIQKSEAEMQRGLAEKRADELSTQQAVLVRRLDDAHWSAYQKFVVAKDTVGCLLTAATAKAYAEEQDILSVYDWEALSHVLLGDHPSLAGIVPRETPWTCMAFSPSGELLVAGDAKGSVHFVDPVTAATVATVKAHSGPVRSLAFGGGATFASGGTDGAVWLWEADTRERTEIVGNGPRAVGRVSLSRDGKLVAWAHYRGNANVLRVGSETDGKPLAVAHGKACVAALSPDGTWLAAAVWNRLYLWEVASGRRIGRPMVHVSLLNDVVFSPDGSWIVSGCNGGVVKLWRTAAVVDGGDTTDAGGGSATEGAQPAFVLRGHAGGVAGVAFGPDPDLLAASSKSGVVKLWSVSTGELRAEVRAHATGATCMAFSVDGTLVSGNADGTVRFWDVGAEKECVSLDGDDRAVFGLCYSPDGSLVATCGAANAIRIWDAATGRPVAALTGFEAPAFTVAFRPDGRLLASGHDDGTVRLWDVMTSTVLGELAGHSRRVERVAFSPDGRLLASGATDSSVRLWDPEAGREVQAVRGRAHHVKALAFSPDGTFLAWGGWDNTVRVWDLAEGRERHCLRGRFNGVMCLDCADDGSGGVVIAAGTYDGKLLLWDAASGKSLGGESAVQGAAVFGVGFVPGVGNLVTASWDGTVKLWCGRTRRPLRTFEGHVGGARCVAAAPRGSAFASGGEDGIVKLWGVSLLGPRSVDQSERATGAWLVGFNVEPLPKYRFANASSTDPFLRLCWSAGHPNQWLARARKGDGEAMYRLAVIRERQGRDEVARELHLGVTQLEGDAARRWAEESRSRLSRLPWLQSGEAWEEARRAAAEELARVRDPERWGSASERGVPEAMYRLAVILERTGSYEDARALHRRVVAAEGSAQGGWGAKAQRRLDSLPWFRDPELYRLRDEAQRRLCAEDFAGVSRLCKELTEAREDEGRLLAHDLAQDLCGEAEGLQTEGAERLLQAAVGISPDHVDSRRKLAEVLEKLGKQDEAMGHLRQAAGSPDVPVGVLGAIGGQVLGLGDFEGATEILERALAMDTQSPRVRLDLALALLGKRDLGRAIAHFTWFGESAQNWLPYTANRVESLLARHRGTHEAHYALGFLRRKAGDATLARQHYAEFLRVAGPGEYRDRAQQELSELDAEVGTADARAAPASAGTGGAGSNAGAHERARTVAAKGPGYYTDGSVQGDDKKRLETLFNEAAGTVVDDPDTALAKLNEAVELDPGNANLRYLRAAAYAQKGQWPQMKGALKRGNSLSAYMYVNYTGVEFGLLKFPHVDAMRGIARRAEGGGRDALLAARAMGRRAVETKPVTAMTVIAGVDSMIIADEALIRACQAEGDAEGVALWTGKRNDDRRWGETFNERYHQFTRQSGRKAQETLKEAGLPADTFSNLGTVELTEAQKKKVNDAFTVFIKGAAEVLQNLLSTLPE